MSEFPEIDWTVATRVGGRLVPAGPKVTPAEAAQVVRGLRDAADTAADIIAERSGLQSHGRSPVLILDRPGWVAANADMAAELLRNVVPTGATPRVVKAAVGTQAGMILAAVSVRILGQFEGLSARPRLLLVAPNAVAFERNSGIPPRDFRLWACLHEQTHQFQFGHAPWLTVHLLDTVRRFFGEDHSDEQTEISVSAITAVMTFLEGHAEVQMDISAAGLIDSVPALRARLDTRRRSPGVFAVVQRVVGLNEKVSQYERGAVFCRRLYDRGGVELLNRPLCEPDALPTPAEIDDPSLWLKRVG